MRLDRPVGPQKPRKERSSRANWLFTVHSSELCGAAGEAVAERLSAMKVEG